MNKTKGLIAATYTPMLRDESLNLDLIPEYINYLQNNKVNGAFINGTTGDFASMSVKERKDVLDSWAEHKPKDFILFNHVGHTSLKVAKELAEHSKGKVDAIAALSPFYFKLPSIEHLVEYCAQIASVVPELPFYYYHIPILSGSAFSMELFLQTVGDQIPNLAGIKYSNLDLEDLSKCIQMDGGKYDILFGVDEALVDSLDVKTTAWVGSTYNHIPRLYEEIMDAYQRGQKDKADELQKLSIDFVQVLDEYGGYSGSAKSIMKLMGLDCGPSRFPHTTLNEKSILEIKTIFEQKGIIDYLAKR